MHEPHGLNLFLNFPSHIASAADIDTLPLLAWHEDMVKKLDSSTAQLIRYQQYLFFPLLCFARMTWAQQSFAHARLLSKIARAGSIEVGLLCVHYMTFLALPVAALGTLQGVTFFILAQVWLEHCFNARLCIMLCNAAYLDLCDATNDSKGSGQQATPAHPWAL